MAKQGRKRQRRNERKKSGVKNINKTVEFKLEPVLALEAKALQRTLDEAIEDNCPAAEIDSRVQKKFREFLLKRLPKRCFIDQCYIMDRTGAMSELFDVVIADESSAGLTLDQYERHSVVPYESVYAVGSIHAYLDCKNIGKFGGKVARLLTELIRERNAPNAFKVGRNVVATNADKVQIAEHCYKNPLLSFFVAVDSKEFSLPEHFREDIEGDWSDVHKLKEVYDAGEANLLPTHVTVLNSFSIIAAELKTDKNGNLLRWSENITPQYVLEVPEDRRIRNDWILIRPGKEADCLTANLYFLVAALIKHFEMCMLTEPNIWEYTSGIFESLLVPQCELGEVSFVSN